MDINTIKDILNTWLNDRLKETIKFREGKNDIHINSSVLQLENWLMDWRKDHNLNERIDAKIISDNILKNVTFTSSERAFKPKDYQFNFLFFLARNYKHDIELYELIDLFIEKFKDQFSFADIIVTKTGATRCKTNIRFALDELRNLGMVLNRDTNGKRTWSPSIPGLITLLNIQYQFTSRNSNFIEKEENSLTPIRPIAKYLGYPFDGTLYDSIQMFREETYLYEFINWLSITEKEEKKLIKDIIHQYLEFTLIGIEIKANGLKRTKEFSQLSKAFQKDLFENQKKNIPFMNSLLRRFQEKDLFGN